MIKPISVLATNRQGATLRNNATKVEVLVDWITLEAAASQDDATLRLAYGDALADALAMNEAQLERERRDALAMNEAQLERERRIRVAGCRKHRAIGSVERAYTGSVSRDENRAAHGNICIVETCACGATRRTNVNGQHSEQGVWL